MAETQPAVLKVDPSVQVDLSTIPISPEGENVDVDQYQKKITSSLDEQITVFHDRDNFNGGDHWNELLKQVITFSSVEEFWGVYNNIAPVSQLAIKSDYHLFKEGIRPEWEDPKNKHGGKWSYQFKDKRNTPIDELWLHVMLSAIGETLEGENDGEVMGVVVNVRKVFYRIGVWTHSTGNRIVGGGDGDVAGGKGRSPEKGKEILINIGRTFKEITKLPPSEVVEFTGHTESINSQGSSRARPKYSV
ncbi:Eukaryotic translation initiation factor 4E-1 [Erysiphe neolycopersici]|uniref:Eukaryotic translation initiation factor 4E-1 n=1 Tax=Erysiphe neolycopersici TaxID=212602 RepID=A0A420HXD7_9PEZI|nr:Eukaryotic translation initiation factor 4E-1 [Erysiphe neolycopersici]